MSAPLLEALEMDTTNEETAKSDHLEQGESEENASPESPDSMVESASELELPLWSIITFEDVAVRGLTYEEAVKWMENLSGQNISGLCIVTDEAAARASEK